MFVPVLHHIADGEKIVVVFVDDARQEFYGRFIAVLAPPADARVILFEQPPFTLCQHPFPRRNDFYSLIIQRQSRLFTNSDNGQLVAAGRF